MYENTELNKDINNNTMSQDALEQETEDKTEEMAQEPIEIPPADVQATEVETPPAGEQVEPAEIVMVDVVGVRFKKAGKVYSFAPSGFDLKTGDEVVVETARGMEVGHAMS